MKFTISTSTVLPFRGLKNVQIFDTVVPLPGTNPKEIIKYEVKDLFIFTTASLQGNQTKYSTVKECLNKAWYINLMECYATTKNLMLQRNI